MQVITLWKVKDKLQANAGENTHLMQKSKQTNEVMMMIIIISLTQIEVMIEK
jgi:hypothetical protein